MKLADLFLREDDEQIAKKKPMADKPEADEDGITDVIPQDTETPPEEGEDDDTVVKSKVGDEDESTETPPEDETPSEEQPPEDENADVEPEAEDEDDEPTEDVGSVSRDEGFEKSSDEIFAFGKTRKVTTLTKDEMLGGLDLTLQYIINPETGAWSFRVCLAGQSTEDMVEFATGEDPSSLIKHLKRKKKISAHQAAEYLHPPANKGDDGDDA